MTTVNCFKCVHKRNIPGDCHVACVNPDWEMTGNSHGIENGWFWYPFNFDPCWMTKECCNFTDNTPEVTT